MILAVFLAVGSCTGDDDDDNNDDAGAYFPTFDGSEWIYDVTDHLTNNISEGKTRISGTHTFNNANCQVLIETDSAYPNEEVHSYFVHSGTDILGYGLELYENGQLTETIAFPSPFLSYDYPFSVNQEWQVFHGTGLSGSDIHPDLPNDFDDDGIADTVDLLVTARVPEQRDITVPAGTYSCYKIITTYDLVVHSSLLGDFTFSFTFSVDWFTPYIGFIQNEYYDEENHLTETAKLKSYSINK